MVTHKKIRLAGLFATYISGCILCSSCGKHISNEVSATGIDNLITETTTIDFSEIETTTVEITTPETTIFESATSEPTTPKATTTEISTEVSSSEVTTDSITNNTDYIYYKVRNDNDCVAAMGNISITDEELSRLNELIDSYNKDISFKAVSVDGSRCLSYNSDEQYFAASSIKAPYLLYCYMQLDQGNGTLDEEMIYTSEYYKDGSGDIKNSTDGTVYSLQEIMRRVMWNSDNSAYYMCTRKWGTEGYNAYIEAIGCENFKISPYNIWVYDIRAEDLVITWKHIYDYFESDAKHADIFYNSCIDHKYNFLSGALPGYTIADKYGVSSNNNVYCDGAIVYGNNCTYILSIFTASTGEAYDKAFIADMVSNINAIMDK